MYSLNQCRKSAIYCSWKLLLYTARIRLMPVILKFENNFSFENLELGWFSLLKYKSIALNFQSLFKLCGYLGYFTVHVLQWPSGNALFQISTADSEQVLQVSCD